VSLKETNVPPQHCLDLISAFKQDAVQPRYKTWDDLIDYCQRSAAPVGRYLLDLHGEDKALYVPTDWLEAQSLDVTAIATPVTSPELRVVFNRMLSGTEDLLTISKTLAPAMQNRHLRAETRVIQKIAETLTKRLYAQDPIATRVKLSKPAAAVTAIRGLLRL